MIVTPSFVVEWRVVLVADAGFAARSGGPLLALNGPVVFGRGLLAVKAVLDSDLPSAEGGGTGLVSLFLGSGRRHGVGVCFVVYFIGAVFIVGCDSFCS